MSRPDRDYGGGIAGPAYIDSVTFALSTDADVLELSAGEITEPLLYANQMPVPGGVYDPRLGATEYGVLCGTCHETKRNCPGHRGVIRLRAYVPQPIGVDDIRRWLHVVCFRCGALLVPPERYERQPPALRLSAAAATDTNGSVCGTCGEAHPRVVRSDADNYSFLVEVRPREGREPARTAPLYGDALHAIFARVREEDAARLGRGGRSHPRNLLIRELPAPPNTIRPGVRAIGGSSGSSYHDTTNVLQKILRENKEVRPLPPELTDYRLAAWSAEDRPDVAEAARRLSALYLLVYDMLKGSSATTPAQGASGRRGLVVGSRRIEPVLRRLPRKEGRIRGNLLGKRVFFISRSTISGKSLRIDEVGIPLSLAQTLQVEETVQPYNAERLMPFFLNGRRQYPGCSFVVRAATGEVHDVEGLRSARLEPGDTLYRDLVNGDVVYFNRQPTLERSSMGVHRVRVVQDPSIQTFQMNVLTCEFYNADFDGDQMNIFAPRSPAARAEAAVLSAVENWFISTKTSGPVNGEVQDSVIGSYELTRDAVRLDKRHAMMLFARAGGAAPRFDALPAAHIYSGREAASLLLRQAPVSLARAPASYSDVYAPYVDFPAAETHTVIRDGELVSGVLDKATIGTGREGGVFHLAAREYGPARALELIYSLQQLALGYLLQAGITVCTADLVPAAEDRAAIARTVALAAEEAALVSERLLRGEVVPPIGETVLSYYERLQLNALKPNEGELLRRILSNARPATNGFYKMIATGSKGTNPNLVNVLAVIGQTTINGARIEEAFAFGRTLPYFTRHSVDPLARGFVQNSYISGMTGPEFVFQAMNGRFDLINKALSTSQTGSFMRKGVMSNQSSVVDCHRRVVKNGRVVQFIYGEDGADARELERVPLWTIPLDDAALAARCIGPLFGDEAAPPEQRRAGEAAAQALAQLRADRDWMRAALGRAELANFGQQYPDRVLLPVNAARLAARLLRDPAPPPASPGDWAALAARIERLEAAAAALPYAHLNETQERLGARVPRYLAEASRAQAAHLRAEFSPAVLARLSDAQLGLAVAEVRLRYGASLVAYGECVGVLAGQAISEPLTQYMLDSHHRSVAGGTSKAGLVRIDEVYGAKPAKKERSPVMQVLLEADAFERGPDGVYSDEAVRAAQRAAVALELVTLRDFVRQYDTLLEPYPAAGAALVYPPFAGDAAWIEESRRAHPLAAPGEVTNLCVRFALDKAALELKAIELDLIVRRLRAAHPGVFFVHTSEAVGSVVVRAWLRRGHLRREDEDPAAALLATPVRGAPGIVRATVRRLRRHEPAPGGGLAERERLALETLGTDLYHAMLWPGVDRAGVISNSVADTLRVFGIEAAREKIVSETRAIMDDNTPNFRHVYIYADEMTRTGRVTSVERAGLAARESSNILLRMAYGDPINVVTTATLNAVTAPVYGIAAPLVLGSVPRVGSLYSEFVVDEEFVRENTVSVNSILDNL